MDDRIIRIKKAAAKQLPFMMNLCHLPDSENLCCRIQHILNEDAKGFSLNESIQRAKNYISGALAAMLDLGKGSGPMNHAFALNEHI